MPRIHTPLRLAAVVAAVITAAATLLVADVGQASGGSAGNGPHGGGHDGGSEFAPFAGDGESTHCPNERQQERNKRNAVAYYETAFNDHEPELAVARYGGAEYIQHNPLAANGFEAFIAFVNDFAAQFPELNIDIRRVFAECDFVITHGIISGADPVFGELGNKVVDIFRLDRRGRIVEHWDVLSAISATSANGNPEV
jgi:predicted SnoaL-like aldol condensation-catalyzing enzyme